MEKIFKKKNLLSKTTFFIKKIIASSIIDIF